MSDYAATAVTGAYSVLARTTGAVRPHLRFVCQGRNGGQIKTWVSESMPDLKPETHTNAVVLGQWYSER